MGTALQRRPLVATIVPMPASWREGAPTRRGERGRRGARNSRQATDSRRPRPRHRTEQSPGVGVLRAVEDVGLRTLLDGPAGVHDQDPVGELGDDPHVVGDQDDRRAVVSAQPAEQVEHLRLRGDVERGRRLVGDEQRRVVRQAHRNDGALTHAAGELMRVVVHPPLRVGDADLLEQLHRPGPGGRPGDPGVRSELLGDVPADGVDRGQRRHRILEDHRDVAAAQAPQLVVAHGHEVLPAEQRLAFHGAVGIADQLEDAHHRHALARAGFADDAEHLPLGEGERQPVDGSGRTTPAAERHPQIAYVEQRLRHVVPAGRAMHRPCRRRRWPARRRRLRTAQCRE